MFRTILAATDLSACAARGVDIAAAWAAHDDARLEIVHVFDQPLRAVPGGEPLLRGEAEAAHGRDVAARLEHEVDRARLSVPAASGVIVRGKPHEAIARHATAIHADLVVIGARGLGMVESTLLGSVADRVLRSSPTPVLLVPERARGELLPKTIVAPTDFSAAATAAIERAERFARELGARLEIVHAWTPGADVPTVGAIAEDVAGAVLARVRESHRSARGTLVHHHVREGAAPEVILRLVDEVHADLVVIASTGRSRLSSWLLGGVTDRVVRASPVPVWVLRGATTA